MTKPSDGTGGELNGIPFVLKDSDFGPFINFKVEEPTGGADALNEALADIALVKWYVESGADAETVCDYLNTVQVHVMRAFGCLWTPDTSHEDGGKTLTAIDGGKPRTAPPRIF